MDRKKKEIQKDQRLSELVIPDCRSPFEDVTTEGVERDSEGSMKEQKDRGGTGGKSTDQADSGKYELSTQGGSALPPSPSTSCPGRGPASTQTSVLCVLSCCGWKGFFQDQGLPDSGYTGPCTAPVSLLP